MKSRMIHLNEESLFEQLLNSVILMDLFAEEPSLAAVVDVCADELKNRGFGFDLTQLVRVIETELWWQACDRHEAPWFSEGIKAELRARGCPVTVEDSLDTAFRGREEEIRGLIDRYGLEEAPGYLERLWGPDHGFFFAPHEEIRKSWSRVGII